MSLADGYTPRPEQPGPKAGGWLVRLVLAVLGKIKRKGMR